VRFGAWLLLRDKDYSRKLQFLVNAELPLVLDNHVSETESLNAVIERNL
jgi:hypothetical protein